MPTSAQVRAAVDAYVERFARRDRDGWLGLFADHAVVVDPVPSQPAVGREAIGAFWDAMAAMADQLTLRRRALHVCGDQAAMVYTLVAGPAGGGGVAFDGVEIFTVDDDGLISAATAYWDAGEIYPAPEAPAAGETSPAPSSPT